jgi:hypothetical protein
MLSFFWGVEFSEKVTKLGTLTSSPLHHMRIECGHENGVRKDLTIECRFLSVSSQIDERRELAT